MRSYVQIKFSPQRAAPLVCSLLFAAALSLTSAAPISAQNSPAASKSSAPVTVRQSDKDSSAAPSPAKASAPATSQAAPATASATRQTAPTLDVQSLPLASGVRQAVPAAEMSAQTSRPATRETDRQHEGEIHLQSAPVISPRDRVSESASSTAATSSAAGKAQQKIRNTNVQAAEQPTEGATPGAVIAANPPANEDTDLGEKVRVLESYEKSRSPARAASNAAQPEAPRVVGASYTPHSEKHEATAAESEALSAQSRGGDHAAEARSLNVIGRNFAELGSNQKALAALNQALTLAAESGDRVSEASIENNLGATYSNMGNQQAALELVNKAMPVLRESGNPALLAGGLNNRGIALSRSGQREAALKDFQEALSLALTSGDRIDEAIALSNIGRMREVQGANSEAVDNYTGALTIYQSLHDPLGEADTMFLLFDYWRVQHNPSLAIFFGKEAIDRYQSIRLQLAGLEKQDKDSFVHSKEEYYREIAGVLIGEGRLPEAQEVLDLLKVEEYTEFSQRRGALQSSTRLLAMTATESAVDVQITKADEEITSIGREWSELKAKQSRSATEDARLDLLSGQLTSANQHLQEFLRNLYSSFGKGNQANRDVSNVTDAIGSLQNIEQDLTNDTAAVYTLVLDDKVEAIVITPSTNVAREFPINRADLRLKVFSFVAALSRHESADSINAKSNALYKILVAPVEKDLAGAHARTVLWSLDDVLRYVPMSALYDGHQYLLERFQNIVITTASIGNLRDEPHIQNWNGVAMGISKDYDGLGALNAVPEELSSVVHAANMPKSHGPMPGTILLDDSFTEKNMEAVLDKHVPLVHVASHFVFHAGDDTKSYLLLGGKETGGQAFHLTLADLRDDQNLSFRGVELLTIAGCQTAVGSNDSDGREIDGLGIVAQRKGAKAVVATLWPVDDASVGILMTQFYKNWVTTPGITKAEALRLAQIALLRGPSAAANQSSPQALYANPYFWAPFILIGNWK